MQKIELRKNLLEIINKTKSREIIEFFNNQKPLPTGYSNSLLSVLIQSKSGFDQSILDERQNNILEQFNAKKYYETIFYSTIIKFVSNNNQTTTISYLQKSNEISNFFTYHNTLITTYNLIDSLLFQDPNLRESVEIENFKMAEEQGFLTFEMISEENIDLQNYSEVISGINELISLTIDVISNIEKLKFESKPILILADSGSNTILSIKLPKEISKVVANIINDAWKFLTNKSGYNLEKLNNNLGESLEILKKIKKAETEKLISPEQAEIWKRGITKSTEQIVMNNTLTKSKSEEIYTISNQKMLTEVTKKYLTEGNK